MATSEKLPERYLGDGVYASCDGYGITLDLRAQDDTTRIYLEPEVLRSLDDYRAELKRLTQADALEKGES